MLFRSLRLSPALVLLLLLPISLSSVGTAAENDNDEAKVTEGVVSAVTVYQGQALVTRDIALAGTSGLAEVVVTQLPDNVLPASLYAEPGAGVEIRSVRYRVRPMERDVREEVRELDEKIQALNDQLAANARQKQLMGERLQYLGKLEQFTTTTANHELQNGVLNAETLKELTGFNFEQRADIANTQLELEREQRDLRRQVETAQRERGTIAAGLAQSLREAIVFVNVVEDANPSLRLNYLVNNATWSPSYNLRANGGRNEVRVEYNASIQQRSGEDWTNVEMTLSTATPSLVAEAPSLDPLVVKLGRAAAQQAAESTSSAKGYKLAKKQLERQRMQIANARGNAAVNRAAQAPTANDDPFSDLAPQTDARESDLQLRAGGGFGGGGAQQRSEESFFARDRESADRFLNEIAQKMQILDYNTARIELKKKDELRKLDGEGVSVSYKLASRMTLPSRSDRQLIQITSQALSANFYRLATPVLTSSVFEEARPANASDRVLLAGPASTFLGGEFVGRGEVPTVAIGEDFSVGLGIDSSLRTSRELIDKAERIQGGNRVVDFTYELAIENFGDVPAQVRLLDRMPTAGQADIKVTLVKSDQPISDERDYQKVDQPEGILRWDVEVPANATGVDRYTLRYTMQIEYDKQLSIVGLPAKR